MVYHFAPIMLDNEGFLHLQKTRETKLPGTSQTLLFSVIISTYQRKTSHLEDTLRALAKQDFPVSQFEVIVVDDGSVRPPVGITGKFRDVLNLVFLKQPRSGPATARNRGAAAAQGKFLAFTDDDCVPHKNWLSSLAGTFALDPSNMVGGKNLNAYADNIFSATTQMHLDFLLNYYNNNSAQPTFFVSHNLALSSDLFKTLGGFDPAFFLGGEDRDLCRRWLDRGYRMTYDSNAIVYHLHDLSFHSFLIQHYNYGCGAFRFRNKVAKNKSKRIEFEELEFYLKCILYPFSSKIGKIAPLYSVLLIFSQIANAWGVLRSGMTSGSSPWIHAK